MPSLLDLPTELLMEIVMYQPELDVDVDAYIYPGRPAADRFQGNENDPLRALSQTCRTLHRVSLPVLWARVHACFASSNPFEWRIRTRPKVLERRMIGIQKTPYVVPYIRWLTVTLLECNMSNWKPMTEFIRVLGLLPNPQDLTILQVSSEMVPVLESSCHGKVFPSVLKLTLSDRFKTIMHCFPNVGDLGVLPEQLHDRNPQSDQRPLRQDSYAPLRPQHSIDRTSRHASPQRSSQCEKHFPLVQHPP
ncbi:hypothetical protein DFH06DRAFT_1474783 [Mycena polygramma]|nr:hypothetical protein DFH06DRAFT_1474783 [Mycena polygramma]